MTQPQNAHFMISMPLQAAENAADSLRRLDVDFRPQRDMIVLYEGDTFNDEARGEDANNIRELINDFLRDNGLSPRIPAGKLDLVQTHQMLLLAHSEFHWHKFNSVNQQTDPDRRPWSAVAADYPALFPNHADAQPTSTPCDECSNPASLYDNVSDRPLCRDCAADKALQRMTDDGEFEPLSE